MKYSLRKIATGVGVAGLLGAAGAIAEDTQSYQKGQPDQQSATTPNEPGLAQPGQQQGQQEQPQGAMSQQRQGKSWQSAQNSKAEAMRGEKEQRGTIRFVDPSSRTLSLKESRMRHRDIAWADNTEVLKNGKPVGAAALQKGERVTVIVGRDQSGKLFASQIIIRERQQARAGKHAHQER
jgi:hypothetical protein